MNKKRFGFIASALLLLCGGLAMTGTAQAQTENSAYLILWNVSEKSGDVLKMDDEDGDGAFTLESQLAQGQYTYRVAVGESKRPVYGLDGKENGKPIPLELAENRTVTFTFRADTHLIDIAQGDTFVPARRVVLVGNLQNELGHTGGQFGGEWDPAAETTRMKMLSRNFYVFTGHLPVGLYEYKVAVGGSWAENYGQDGKMDGANIPLEIKTEQDVTFYYQDDSHKITDSTRYALLPDEQLPRLVGNFPADADLLLRDQEFSGIYSVKLALPQGEYAYHVAVGAEQKDVYGKDGKLSGDKVAFSLPEAKEVTFLFDMTTHQPLFDDGSIRADLLYHDTYRIEYRAPFEAVPTGQEVTLRLQAGTGDLKTVALLVNKATVIHGVAQYDTPAQKIDMRLKETKTVEGVGEVDVWEGAFTLTEPALYGYKFRLNDFKEYGDDSKGGGTGATAMQGAAFFPLTVYDAAFTTPNWMKEAIIYQIFPDRFFNGNPANDAAKTTARGAEPTALKQWNDLPGIPNVNDNDAYFNNDFFGGDLEGIRQKLDYLQSLGVTVLYLNPIFTAASNHKYDPGSYEQIDPMFGTAEDFKRLTDELRKRGMYLMLDGVFNHVGDDSIYFDRYGKYKEVGAYEYWARVYETMNAKNAAQADAQRMAEEQFASEGTPLAPYAPQTWFKIENTQENGHFRYEGWSGYDSLPVIQSPENGAVSQASELNNQRWAAYILLNDDAIAKRWIKSGASGWRLDVAPEIDAAFWREFRKQIKPMTLPNGEPPVMLGETFQDAAHFFLGDQFDSVMNYGFRYAIQKLLMVDGDAAAAAALLRGLQQNYPKEAVYNLMNLFGSHDTPRIIYLLGGGDDTGVIAEKGKHFDYELGKKRLKLAVIFQMGYPGAPTIYYGDEVGVFGSRDPDCRRPFPWGSEDHDLLDHYRKVAGIRAARKPLFAHGDVTTLFAENDVYVYARKFEQQCAVIAINRGSEAKTLSMPVSGWIADGAALADQLDAAYTVSVSGGALELTIPAMTGRMLVSQ